MTLIDDVQAVCRRLVPQGWADLLAQHGLDITAADPIGHCKLFLVLVLRAIYTSTRATHANDGEQSRRVLEVNISICKHF